MVRAGARRRDHGTGESVIRRSGKLQSPGLIGIDTQHLSAASVLDGQNRVAGEEWLVRRAGDYLPGAYEEVVERCSATVNLVFFFKKLFMIECKNRNL